MRKAEKRRIGAEKQAINRAESIRLGLAAQTRDREHKEKAKRSAENPVAVRKATKKTGGPKKFGPVTRSFKGDGLQAGS